MNAIVLSFDKQVVCQTLLYSMYENLWSKNQFIFRIPYNNGIESTHSHFAKSRNVNLIKCGVSILDTMEALLDGIGDDEWVYWCCDDRFPSEIDVNENNLIFDELYNQGKYDEYDFVKNYAPGKKQQKIAKKCIEIDSKKFLVQQKNFKVGFWMNHYVKAKVLKRLFSKEFEKNENKIPSHWGNGKISKFKPTSINHFPSRLNCITDLVGLWREQNYIKFLEPIIDGVKTKHFHKFYKKPC